LLVDVGAGVDACTCWINGSMPLIAVRGDISGDRQRLSVAHELGHLLMDIADSVNEEKAAFRFGAAFLVPQERVRRELGDKRHAIRPEELLLLKRRYGLSVQAWVRRAQDIGVISSAAVQVLFKQFSARGWRKVEPEEYPPENPERIEQIVLRALAEGQISEARATELMGKPPRQFVLEGEGTVGSAA